MRACRKRSARSIADIAALCSEMPGPWKTRATRGVMFVTGYEDGRTAYLSLTGPGAPSEDDKVLAIARERQAKGELPEGTIVSTKRVR